MMFIPAVSLTPTALSDNAATKEQHIKIKIYTRNKERLTAKNRIAP
jgi:hypothetical protein